LETECLFQEAFDRVDDKKKMTEAMSLNADHLEAPETQGTAPPKSPQ
jgi:hypothetical protein